MIEIDTLYQRYCFWLSVYTSLLCQPIQESVADRYVIRLARMKFEKAYNEFTKGE